MRRSLILLAALPFAASCVPQVAPPAPPPPPAQPVVPVAMPSPALGSDWRDWPVTPGNWRYTPGAAGRSSGTFGTGPNGYLVGLACNAGQVILSVPGGPAPSAFTVRSSSLVRTLQTSGATREVRLAARDPLLDAMAFSRGHFTVEEAGRPPLVIPAWPEIGRVIEDCRG